MMELQAQLDRLRIIQALRFSLLAISIFVVSALMDLSTGIISLVPGIVLVLFLKDETPATSLKLLAGLIFGAAVFFLLSSLWAQVPLLLLIISLIVIFALSYLAEQGIKGRSGFLAFALGAELCLLSALFAEISGAALGIDAAQAWLTELPVGIVLLWILLLGLWPSPTAADLDRLVHATRRECAALLRKTIQPVRDGVAISYVPSRVNLKFLGELSHTVDLNAAKFKFASHSHAFMIARLESLAQIYANIRYIQRAFEDLPEPGLSAEARAAAAAIMAALSDRVGGAPAADISEAVAAVRREEQRHTGAATDDLASRRLAARMSGFLVAAEELGTTIAAYDRPEQAPAKALTAGGTQPHLMVDSLQTSIKIVLGVLLGILVFMFTGLPASSYLVIAILIVLVQPNLGRAHLRFQLWFPGVMFGSLWALAGIMVLSVLPHFGVYLAWMLPGLFLAGYLGSGPDRIAYVGIQIAAAMATILGMAVYPADNVMSADTRIVGAAVGFIIALSIYHFVWPVHPAALLRQNLVRNLRSMVHMLSRIDQVESVQRDPRREADLMRKVATLKLQVQANIGLLYDISYLVTSRLRPAYRYQVLAHQLGMIHAQIWCLQQALSQIDDIDRRRTILAPIAAASEPLSQVFTTLADRLDRRKSASALDIRESMETVRSSLAAFHEPVAAGTGSDDRTDTEYGINAISMMIFHLNNFAGAMNFAQEAAPPRTEELEHYYGATDP
jgi:uncharacterized membrane protein YccC